MSMSRSLGSASACAFPLAYPPPMKWQVIPPPLGRRHDSWLIDGSVSPSVLPHSPIVLTARTSTTSPLAHYLRCVMRILVSCVDGLGRREKEEGNGQSDWKVRSFLILTLTLQPLSLRDEKLDVYAFMNRRKAISATQDHNRFDIRPPRV
ncbi:hypothetical protein DFH06DRAFT_1251495 [Mycena polygramma]|nr:hypothetical protein DFH06DRAFT_1251495 [Mycena polygramma]